MDTKEKKRNIIFESLKKFGKSASEGWKKLPSNLKDIYNRKKRIKELTESIINQKYPGGLSDSASNMLLRDKINKQLKEGTYDLTDIKKLRYK